MSMAWEIYEDRDVIVVDDDDEEEEEESKIAAAARPTRQREQALAASAMATPQGGLMTASTQSSSSSSSTSSYSPSPCNPSSQLLTLRQRSSPSDTDDNEHQLDHSICKLLDFDVTEIQDPQEDQIIGRPLNSETGKKSIFVDFNEGNQCTGEELALQHYASEGEGSWWGLHCEGSVIRTLFGLLLWDDVIFLPVRGVFPSPFQDCPLDLDHPPLFYYNRKGAIETKLAEISGWTSQQVAEEVVHQWRSHYGTCCRGVNWNSRVEVLQGAAIAMGGHGLAVAFRPLCLNYRHFSGG